jgi:hypothetical protein
MDVVLWGYIQYIVLECPKVLADSGSHCNKVYQNQKNQFLE